MTAINDFDLAVMRSLQSQLEEDIQDILLESLASSGSQPDDGLERALAASVEEQRLDDELALVLAISGESEKPNIPEGHRIVRVRADGNCAIYAFLIVLWLKCQHSFGRSCPSWPDTQFFAYLETFGARIWQRRCQLSGAVTAIRQWLRGVWTDGQSVADYGLGMIDAKERVERAVNAVTQGAFLDDADLNGIMRFAGIYCQRTIRGTRASYVGLESSEGFVPGVSIEFNGLNHYDVIVRDDLFKHVQVLLEIFPEIATL